jgi:hypothetical protein
VLTDGQTPDAKYDDLVANMRRAGVTVTAVAVGRDANIPLLRRIADAGGGKFYSVLNPHNLPRIFLTEVRRVARPLVYEPPAPVVPRVVSDHEILNGIEGVPPIRGLVLTTVKENPLVEVVLRSPQPATEKNATVLATWTYGAGKATVFTTDGGGRWAAGWPRWEGYNKFFSQLVRWAMRPASDEGNYAIATTVRDGRAQVVVTAVDASEQFLNNQSMTASAIAPDLTPIEVRLEQSAPGRYVGEFPTPDAGTYHMAVAPGAGTDTIRTAVNVSYSAEYRDHETNMALLKSLAGLHAGDGPPGKLTAGLAAARPQADASPFRRDLPLARSDQSAWPWLVVAASCVFWGDVFVRRVHVDLRWLEFAVARWRDRLLRREPAVAASETMRRLRSRKDEIAERIENQQAAAARFELDERAASSLEVLFGRDSPAPLEAHDAVMAKNPGVDSSPAPSYTERLLRAKKDVRRKRADGRRGDG